MSGYEHYQQGRYRQPHVNSTAPRTYSQNGSQFRSRSHRAQINPVYNYVAPAVENRHNTHQNSRSSLGQKLKHSEGYQWIVDNFINNKKALDIFEQMQAEAKVWRQTSLWRFTSRSLFPGGRPLEPWMDQSFEEIRWAHRWMTSQNQEHIYKKTYSDYWENTERQLIGLLKLRIDTLQSLKSYVDEYIASNHTPSKTLSTDVDMKDDNDTRVSNRDLYLTQYTADEQLLADERAAFESETFELGHVPIHPPSQQFC